MWSPRACRFTRSSTADVPPHDIASVFVVPVVGKVPGTLVVSNSTATYTITNFGEQRSGVSTSTLAGVDPPQDTLTPAFNVLEEALWRHVVTGTAPDDLPDAIGLVATVLGAGKDSLARTYVMLASERHVRSLDLTALFRGGG